MKHWNEFYGDLWCDVTIPSSNLTYGDTLRGTGPKWKSNNTRQQPQQSGRQVCKFFNNRGGCREKDNCPDIHRCSVCRSTTHNKFACKDSEQHKN